MYLTIDVLHLAAGAVGLYGLGYLVGRRSFRKKLQTTDGRARLGRHAALPEVDDYLDDDLDAELIELTDYIRTDEIPETIAMEALPPTLPRAAVPIPAPRRVTR